MSKMTASRKSIYQDTAFASYWNERAGVQGEPYKRYVLDPILMKLAGDVRKLDVLELGSGNGYLAPAFVQNGVAHLTLMDISEQNLAFAREKCQDPRISFLGHDATMSWPFKKTALILSTQI